MAKKSVKQQIVEGIVEEQRQARVDSCDLAYLVKRVELVEIKYGALQADFLGLAEKVLFVEDILKGCEPETVGRNAITALKKEFRAFLERDEWD